MVERYQKARHLSNRVQERRFAAILRARRLAMLLTFLLTALSSVAAPAPERPVTIHTLPPIAVDARKACPRAEVRMAERPNGVRAERLIELPPGRLELTVLREFDGCPIPAVLREGVGGFEAPAAGAPRR
jgi:hypothetical protein